MPCSAHMYCCDTARYVSALAQPALPRVPYALSTVGVIFAQIRSMTPFSVSSTSFFIACADLNVTSLRVVSHAHTHLCRCVGIFLQVRTAVARLSSRMLARSASSLPSRAQQILEPMRSLLLGSMPYSLGITASASTLAVCRPIKAVVIAKHY